LRPGSVSFRDGIEEAADLEGISILPADVLEQVERKSAVRAALLVLPEDRRGVLVGKYVEGLSVETIATRMGKTPKAVESLLSRARQQMRDLLGGYMTPLDGEREVVQRPSDDESIES
jgi:RNA polymerase sigma-70 factor (ECF subfamily)